MLITFACNEGDLALLFFRLETAGNSSPPARPPGAAAPAGVVPGGRQNHIRDNGLRLTGGNGHGEGAAATAVAAFRG